ncbi:MAG: ArsR family transcriptional regulator [Thermoplasmata archaeon]|nr:MAG: ArsR family transcriptional regulator [Thermoplasmata archaeon]RLF62033.1 MAG: ArsR family transcriptional regulator [Thermoplasmata archaeon]
MNSDTFFKCVVDSNRRRILEILGDGEKCVNEIVESMGLEQSLVSHHLKVLRECGLVKSRHEGKNVVYTLSTPEIHNVLKTVEKASAEIGNVKPHEECR